MLASQWRVATCRPDTCRVVWQCPLTSLLSQIWINILNGLTWQCLFLKHKMELKVCCDCCSVTHCIWTVLFDGIELNCNKQFLLLCCLALPTRATACLSSFKHASALCPVPRLQHSRPSCSCSGSLQYCQCCWYWPSGNTGTAGWNCSNAVLVLFLMQDQLGWLAVIDVFTNGGRVNR